MIYNKQCPNRIEEALNEEVRASYLRSLKRVFDKTDRLLMAAGNPPRLRKVYDPVKAVYFRMTGNTRQALPETSDDPSAPGFFLAAARSLYEQLQEVERDDRRGLGRAALAMMESVAALARLRESRILAPPLVLQPDPGHWHVGRCGWCIVPEDVGTAQNVTRCYLYPESEDEFAFSIHLADPSRQQAEQLTVAATGKGICISLRRVPYFHSQGPRRKLPSCSHSRRISQLVPCCIDTELARNGRSVSARKGKMDRCKGRAEEVAIRPVSSDRGPSSDRLPMPRKHPARSKGEGKRKKTVMLFGRAMHDHDVHNKGSTRIQLDSAPVAFRFPSRGKPLSIIFGFPDDLHARDGVRISRASILVTDGSMKSAASGWLLVFHTRRYARPERMCEVELIRGRGRKGQLGAIGKDGAWTELPFRVPIPDTCLGEPGDAIVGCFVSSSSRSSLSSTTEGELELFGVMDAEIVTGKPPRA